jgi:hypothetical protein
VAACLRLCGSKANLAARRNDDESLAMTDPMMALSAVASVLQIIDSVTGQWDRFFKKRSEAQISGEHQVTTAQVSSDTIAVTNQGRQVDTITANDLAKLDASSLALIKALETSMQRQYDLWVAVYPTCDVSPDPVVNAQVRQRLNDIARKMCDDLGKILGYLDSIGKNLEDHYGHIRYLCTQIQN